MPILNREDAADVEEQISQIFAVNQSRRSDELRKLFVEKLDFEPASGFVSLTKATTRVDLPERAERLATMSGVTAVYVPLDTPETDRVRKAEAAAAAKLISDELAGDILLVMTNSSASQVHFIYPTFEGAKPSLRRLIVERDNYLRRTAIQQISNFYWDLNDTKDIRGALERLYDVEAVTTRFFQKYKSVFDSVIEKVQGFGPGDDEQESKKLFVQTLFNRLMFVYFLSRKGWLTFNGDKDYLNALWKDYPAQSEDKNFYTNRLRPLFFAGLNNPRSYDLMKDNPAMHALIGDVPFLNGGLFDQWDGDKRDGVTVPDQAIGMILSELFEPFNFTVMESTPLDVEVAVDPEMLGKVFEELVTGRHETGSYYTPRPVVSFMCRESLKGYLEEKNTGATSEAIEAFINEEHDTSGLGIALAPGIAEALNEIKVIDPACGSGAYLLGMMQELVELKTALYSDQLSHQPKDLYDLKLQIIEDSLFGVDIDEFAINIAMLRLWLSLAIDYEGDRPEPLPNLDFKIVCGDSLTAPDPNPDNYGDLFRHRIEELADQLAGLKHDHMSATGQRKIDFSAEISELLEELSECLAEAPTLEEVVDWRVEFAEIFSENGGFDVAIANPPYVRMELFKDLKPMLMRNFAEVHRERSDLYCYFYARALQILRQGGILGFISSNKWLRSNYGSGIRIYVHDHCNVTSITDFGELPVFQAAATFPMIIIASKDGPASRPFLFTQVKSLGEPYPDIKELQTRNGNKLPSELLREELWLLASTEEVNRTRQMDSVGIPLGEYSKGKVLYGIKTGLNKAFIVDGAIRDRLIQADPSCASVLKPVILGDHIRKWHVNRKDKWLIYTYHGIKLDRRSLILEYLEPFREGLERRATQQAWYELQQPQQRYSSGFASPKIVFPDIAKESRFSFDREGSFLANTAYGIPMDDFYLLGVLNSSLVWDYLKRTCSVLGDPEAGGRLRLIFSSITRLPIPNPTPVDRAAIALLAENCSSSESVAVDELEQEIDERVAMLYGLPH